MSKSTTNPKHQMIICTSCGKRFGEYRPGLDFLKKFAKDTTLLQDFEICQIECMAACDHPCSVAFKMHDKTTYLFCDLKPDEHTKALIEFAKLYKNHQTGWTSTKDRPMELIAKIRARIPPNQMLS